MYGVAELIVPTTNPKRRKTMETNDYVSYELAVKLKAAGFNELTNSFYDEASVRQGEFEIVPTYAKFNEVCKTPGCECVSAPTLAHTQKWLREKKKIDVLVYNCACGYVWEVSKANCGTGLILYDDNGDDENSGCWTSYEGALSAGISNALELIKKGE